MSIGLARITINTPQRRVDVALPEHVPLAELLPEVLRHAGEGLADDGEQHGGWVLRRMDGTPLHAGQGLVAQGIRDGDVLNLVPARAEWPELEYDDVVEAIADAARRRGTAWSARSTRGAALAGAAVLLVAGLFAVIAGGPGWGLGGPVALGVAVLLTLGGVIASRAYGDAAAGAALGGYAMPYAFIGGALLVATGDPVGVVPLVRWIGAPEALVGSVALLLFAISGLAGIAAGLRVFAAGVTVGALGAGTALAGFFLPASGAAAILLAVLVCGIGIVPLLAIRFGKLPMPPITLPTSAEEAEDFTAASSGSGDAVRERPERSRVAAAVARTEELLTGMLIGHAILSVLATLMLVLEGGLAAWLLVAVSAGALLLRSRLYVTVRQRVPLIAAGLTGVGALCVALAVTTGSIGWLLLSVGGMVAALMTIAAGATYSRRPPSPYLGRAADVLDTLMVVSVVPVACAVLGVYERARGLLG